MQISGETAYARLCPHKIYRYEKIAYFDRRAERLPVIQRVREGKQTAPLRQRADGKRFYGESEHYSLRARSGFAEKEKKHDGKAGALRDELVVTLLSETEDEAEITAEISFTGSALTEKFRLNPVTFGMNAVFEARPETNEFEIIVTENGNRETVAMKSALPENTLSLSGALDALYANQKALVDGYMQNNIFNGEIRAKILVRNGKTYWYMGLIDASGRTRALLIDGASGEILAAKDVF